MTDARLLMRCDFAAAHAQLEFGDIDGIYPGGEFGEAPLLANEEKILVATLPDIEGTVLVEIWVGGDEALPRLAGVLIHDGYIRLSTDEAEAGSRTGGQIERVSVGEGRHRIRVVVDEPGYATKIVVLITP